MIELRIKLDNIDYGSLAQQVLPVALEKLGEAHGDNKAVQALQELGHLPGGVVKMMLKTLPQSTKDAIAQAFLQSYTDELADQISRFAESKGIHFDVVEIQALCPAEAKAEEA